MGVLFAAEAITHDFPTLWGFRIDGESLWTEGKCGWCELGFQETYFRDLLRRRGWTAKEPERAETPWGTILIAERCAA
ncbi:MAG TPA: hypothetical protein DD672_06020 [Gammaproteobacteria bacterium]|nr:hypothetical protein [Gammaproteobacteria bacterium]